MYYFTFFSLDSKQILFLIMFNRLSMIQKNNITLFKFMRFLSSESNKLSKSIWFLIFEHQVPREYIKRFLRKFICISRSPNSNRKNRDSERYSYFLSSRLPFHHWPSTNFKVESAICKKTCMNVHNLSFLHALLYPLKCPLIYYPLYIFLH